MTRDPRQVKIQIARKQLALQDDDYRALLRRIAGVSSSSRLKPRQMDAVLAEMERLGFRPQPGAKGRPAEGRKDLRFIHVLWKKLAEAEAVKPGRQALNAFIAGPTFRAKWGETATEVAFLPLERASDVIEALKDMCRRHNVELRR